MLTAVLQNFLQCLAMVACKLANHPTWSGPQKGPAARVSNPSAQKASWPQDVQQASQHTEPENII
jgi:hypothetical protein